MEPQGLGSAAGAREERCWPGGLSSRSLSWSSSDPRGGCGLRSHRGAWRSELSAWAICSRNAWIWAWTWRALVVRRRASSPWRATGATRAHVLCGWPVRCASSTSSRSMLLWRRSAGGICCVSRRRIVQRPSSSAGGGCRAPAVQIDADPTRTVIHGRSSSPIVRPRGPNPRGLKRAVRGGGPTSGRPSRGYPSGPPKPARPFMASRFWW